MICDTSQAHAKCAGLTQVAPRVTELLLGRAEFSGDPSPAAKFVRDRRLLVAA